VLDEVVRFGRGFLVDSQEQEVQDSKTKTEDSLNEAEAKATLEPETGPGGVKRKTLTGMLSEVLRLSVRIL